MTVTTNEPIATDSKRNGSPEDSGSGKSGKIRNRARDVRRGARLPRRAENSAEPSDSTPRSATPRTAALRSHLGERMASLPERLHKCSPYTNGTPSIRDVVVWTANGGWIPGDHPWWVESPGYAYGVLIAIPGSVVLKAQSSALKMTHAVVVGLFVFMLWLASCLPPDLSWCHHSWLWFGAEVYVALVVMSTVAVLVNRPRGAA